MKLCLAALMVLSFLSGFSQTTPPDLVPGYYVVVASYVKGEESFALAYSAKLNQEGKHSAVGFDNGRKFYHVYLDQYTNFDESIKEMLKARSQGFGTSWVRIMKGSQAVVSRETQPAVRTETAPAKTMSAQPTAATNPAPAASTSPTTPPVVVTASPSATVQSPPVSPATNELQATPPPAPKVAITEISNNDAFVHPKTLTAQPVLFAMFNPTNRESVDGIVEIVDAESAVLLGKAKGNDSLMLPVPKSKTGKLILRGSSFGFRPVQHELNYLSTEKDSLPNFVDVVDNHYRFSFGMDKLRRGDIAVLYNVYFFNDAAVMQPDSKYELNKLLQLLVDNPAYKIMLHGHTNGNGAGKIISMGKSKEFFKLTSEDKSGTGSAKELSRQRAEVIKQWLIANNIDAGRIQVKAHGGSKMIHDKNGPNAKRNVRVEVEML